MADMQCVEISEHGGPEVLRLAQRPVPDPGPGQVRVRVEAAALNHLDLWVRRGVPGHEFPLPIIPGCDFAGIVEAVGPGVDRVAEGDPMVAAPGLSCGQCAHCAAGDDNLCRHYGIFGETCDGGDAEFVVMPAVNVLPRPKGLRAAEAAAVPLVFLTAWQMLVRKARVRAGDTVLIHAAGSGVGSAAIQIARLHGCRVITTAGDDAKLHKAVELGAHVTVNYRTDDFRETVKKETGGAGVQVVVDHVGEDTFGRSMACLAKGGRYVTCGATSGFKMETDFRLVFFKNLEILGSTMGPRGDLHRILRLVEQNELRPVVDRTFPLKDVAEAHAHLENRAQFGKVVLELG